MSPDLLSEEDQEVMQGFVCESRDLIDDVEPQLIELHDTADSTGDIDMEVLNSIFRLFHSMKGSAGFLNLNLLAGVTHEAETLLDLVRKGEITLDMQRTDLLTATCDFVRKLLDNIDENDTDVGYEDEAAQLVQELKDSIVRQDEKVETMKPESVPISASDNAKQPDTSSDDTASQPVVPSKNGGEGIDTGSGESGGLSLTDQPETGAPDPTVEPVENDEETALSKDTINQFVQESDDLITTLEQALLVIDDMPEGDTESIEEGFRAIHSFKGNCGFVGAADLERLCHKIETVLLCIKENIKLPDDKPANLLLGYIDVLRNGLADIQDGRANTTIGVAGLLDFLDEMLPAPEVLEAINLGVPSDKLPVHIDSPSVADDSLNGANAPATDNPAPEPEAVKSDTRDTAPQKEATSTAAPEKKETPNSEHKSVKRRDIRVDVTKLDSLFDIVGELIIAESMVTGNRLVQNLEDEGLDRARHNLHNITSELQDVAMSMRMVPISGTFRKMIRLVHDLAQKSGKQAKLVLIGEETEVDKNIIEQIADPLVHLVRNAVDHGLEPPEERIANGKPETGTVIIEAKHQSGEIWITISEDGRGLNRDKILAKAIEKGLISGDGSDLSDEDINKLIFEPGFSTADTISDISGRGVGMDVVKRNIEKLKGRVDVKSEPNRGTKVIIRIPLTLAIIDGMLVRVGRATYTIPMLNIQEFFQPDAGTITRTMDGQELVKLRTEILPIVRLYELHQIQPDYREVKDGVLAVMEANNIRFCLFVDELLGQQQTVIKALSVYLGRVEGVSGCTVLGSGEISLILDVNSLVDMCRNRTNRNGWMPLPGQANTPAAHTTNTTAQHASDIDQQSEEVES